MQNQIEKFKRKYGEGKQNLIESRKRAATYTRDENQVTAWVRHKEQNKETPWAQQHTGSAQEILTIQQEMGDNYFIVEHAPQLNRACRGPELEVTNVGRNFSPKNKKKKRA